VFILFYRVSALGKTKSASHSSHVENVENNLCSAVLAFCLDVTSGVLKHNDGIVFAIGALDDPMLLGSNCLPRPADFCHHLNGIRYQDLRSLS